MKKRGISPLIATILIIGFTIVLAALIMTWGMDLYKSIKEEQELKAETELICASKIAPVVKASCLKLLPYIQAEIQNNGENDIEYFYGFAGCGEGGRKPSSHLKGIRLLGDT